MDLTGRSTFAPLLSSVIVLGLTLCVAFVLGEVLGRAEDLDLANVLLPSVVLVVTTTCAVAIVVRDPTAPWTPIPWFLLAMATYFGVGALLHILGNEDTIAYAQTYFVVNRDDLFRTNILNSVSICIVLLASIAATWPLGKRPFKVVMLNESAQTRVMWIFAILGIPIKFFLSLPYNMGLLHFVLPGVVGGLSVCSDLLLLALCYRSSSNHKKLIPWAVAFATLSFVGDVLCFSKAAILLTGLSIVLGLYLARPARKTLFVGMCILVLAYVVAVPFVSFARSAVRGSAGIGEGVNDRASVTAEYIRKPGSEMLTEGDQSWWSRINLSNIQAFAMTMHDSGAPGDTFESLAFSLVPRLLWPNKPVISPGTDFNYLASGSDESASSPGVFAEAYWNGGWPCVVMVCTYLGVLFAWFSGAARRAIAARDLRWLPGTFLGLLMAFPENWFITTYVSGTIMTLLYLIAMKLLVPMDHAPEADTPLGVAADTAGG